MKNNNIRILLCYWLIGLAFCHNAFVFATEFEVDGHAVFDIYLGSILHQSRTNNFIVSVRDSEWDILIWPPDNSYRLECSKDTNCLRTLFDNVGYVENRERPIFKEQFLQTLWLTYCSSSSLQSAVDGKIEPIWELDNPSLEAEGFRMPAKWVLDEVPPHFPLEISFINGGIYHGYDRINKKQIDIQLPPPYNLGYTCAVLRVNSTIRTNTMSIPSEFYFETRMPPFNGHQPIPRTIMLGEVDSIKPYCSMSNFLPSYQGEATIWDYCIVKKLPLNSVKGNVLSYLAHNGDWPHGKELDDIIYKYLRIEKLREAVTKTLTADNNASEIKHRQTLVRIVFFGLMGASFFALIVIFLRQKHK